MKLALDHIIHYIDGIEGFSFPENHLKIINGGKHEQLGTKNKLSYIDLSYIEFIDVFDKALVEKASKSDTECLSFAASLERTHYTEGFKRLCYRTDDILKLKEHLDTLGVDTIGPQMMERTQPNGQIVKWQLLYIDLPEFDFELPFFIEWAQSDIEREEALSAHMQTDLSMSSIDITTYDFDALAEVFVTWLGYEVTGGVIGRYFKLEKDGCPSIRLVPGNENKITKLALKTKNTALLGQYLVHDAVYELI